MAPGVRFVESVKAAFGYLADLLMPPACMACGTPVASALALCGPCWAALPVPDGTTCNRCAIPLPIAWAAEAECLGCATDPPPFRQARSPFLYEGSARQMVVRFKHGRHAWGPTLARDMARVAPDWIGPGRVLVPVPLHRWRLARRGYNQALLLARALARAGGAELGPDWLVRVRPTRSTRGLRRNQRLANLAGAISVNAWATDRIRGAEIVLVDDVMTTGATAAACAARLLKAGAASVDVLVYARVAPAGPATYLGKEAGQEAHAQD